MLSITARRTPEDLREVLFHNEYISGMLTTQNSFAQKYGYFEIRSKIPVGVAVWPAFWMLADDGGWPRRSMCWKAAASVRAPWS